MCTATSRRVECNFGAVDVLRAAPLAPEGTGKRCREPDWDGNATPVQGSRQVTMPDPTQHMLKQHMLKKR
jgi:hypothetical protein